MATVNLDTPIERGAFQVTFITLQNLNTDNLRGLHLSNILTMEVNTMIDLIPRLCSLTTAEVCQMPANDLTKVSLAVVGIFVPLIAKTKADVQPEVPHQVAGEKNNTALITMKARVG